MKVSFEGIGEQVVTFKADSGTAAGIPVKIAADNTVCACSDGDAFVGVTGNVESDGFAAVSIHGFKVLSYTGTAPAYGWTRLAANGSGGVKTAETGMFCLVTAVDSASGKVSFFM